MEGQARCKMAGLCAREEAAQRGGYTSHTVIIELARVTHVLMWKTWKGVGQVMWANTWRRE